MSELANTLLSIDFVDATGADICRDDRCTMLGVHLAGRGCKLRREKPCATRSRVHATEPWRAYNYDALHESVYTAVSSVEPRNFATVLSIVENDYGTVCDRSVHRHLRAWQTSGEIVRMDFRGRLHAYLRAGSRLLNDPDLVREQLCDLHQAAMGDSRMRRWGTVAGQRPERVSGGLSETVDELRREDAQREQLLDESIAA